uniref:PCI domain-containing protein n=1 Tax=Physcomitrium patens TaxID=3218 RepID=A0A7I4BKP9_PHYPA
MADTFPASHGDMSRQSNSHDNNRDVPKPSSSNNNNNNNNNSHGEFDSIGRHGFMDARNSHQQNSSRKRNNRPTFWQRGPIAPSMSWRDQSRLAEMGSRNSYDIPDDVHGDAAGRRPQSTGTQPNAEPHWEKGGKWRSRSNKSVPPVRALAAYSDVGVQDEGNLVTSIVGTCQDMCPVREREQRQRLRDLAIFERINGKTDETSATLAVKRTEHIGNDFSETKRSWVTVCRTIAVAELQPSDVRPQHVLWETLQYLLEMTDRRDCTFESVHAFLFDRTRAVRQELSMQCIANSQAITMIEEIVRFHIMSERELQEQIAGLRNDADSQLNLQQLSKSLLTLLNLYSAVEAEASSGWAHEAEFHGYYVLLNLGDRGHSKAEPLALWFRRVRSLVLQAPAFMYCRRVLRCYRSGNYKGFFDLAQKASYLQGCLMELYFGEIRTLALRAINCGGYKTHPFLLGDIAELLLMKEDDTEEFCKTHGLITCLDKGQLYLTAKQTTFSPSIQTFRHQCSLISRKRAPTFFQEIVGVRDKN